MKGYRFSAVICILLLFICSAQGREGYKFRSISPEGGFSYDGVTAIQQDREGFIWIMMDNEIYRFDGYTYKPYSPYFKRTDASKEWIFRNITVCHNGTLLINTNQGIFKYIDTSGEFIEIADIKTDELMTDPGNNLWIRQQDVWRILDPVTREVFTPSVDGEQASCLSNVYCTADGNLYVFGYDGKIYRYDDARKAFNRCAVLPLADGKIFAAKAHKGKLWILHEQQGLCQVDLHRFVIEKRYDIFKDGLSNPCRSFYMDKEGRCWLGTIDGICMFNPETEERSHYKRSDTDPFSLPGNSIWTISDDRIGNIWIGAYAGVVCYVNPDEKNAFETYRTNNSQLSHTPVSAFAEDPESIWVGTEGGGLNRIHKKTRKFQHYTDDQGTERLAFNHIKSLVTDHQANLWIGMYTGGMDCLNTRTGQIRNFKQEKNKNSLKYNNIRKLVAEDGKGLWIAYQSRKLLVSYYSFETDTFTHIDFSEGNEEAYIFDLLRGRENQLWILTGEKIYLLDIKSHAVRAIKYGDDTFMDFHTGCLDASGNLWIGTIGNGLIKYDVNTSEFTSYKELLNRNVSSIFNICYDMKEHLWLGTDNGLIRFDISRQTISKYDKKDGVQGRLYYPLAAMKGADGRLFFGGTDGFTIVYPENISANTHKPNVIISDFYTDYTPVKMNFSNVSGKKEIVLRYDQTNFGIQFSSDNYLIPEKNRFKYRLRGYDDRWTETDANNRNAVYSKTPPGTYYFEILAANNDGLWNDTPTVIKIRRQPAPWLSGPAYLAYLLLTAAVIYLMIRHYHARKKREMQRYLENLENEKKEELHQAQLRFFTNISHDFRTPLSLILASLEKLRMEGLKEYDYRILNSNAKRVLNLVNELMDFRTVESGKMKLEVRPIHVNCYIRELGADFTDYATQKQIHYQILCDPALPDELYIDKNIFEKVVMNLLNNAFKYTPKGGQVSLETHSGIFCPAYQNSFIVKGDHSPEDTFCIVVRDSGVGISKDSIQFIFERFYKVNTTHFDSHLGSGIGLALVKSLVLLHRGMISVFSERGRGTDIAVHFSKDKGLYEEEHFLRNDAALGADEEGPPAEEEEDAEIHKMLENDLDQIRQKNKKRILLVEDHDDLRRIIAHYFADEYEVIQAEDGMKASALLSEKMIDLIICDIMMPRKDGITFGKEVKKNIETSHIPLILLTAKTSLESKLEGADSGADIYFEKPVDLQLLKLSVRNVFKQQQQLKEYYAKNYFADSAELSSNEKDAKFMQEFVRIIEENLDHTDMDVHYIASQLSMSRSKLYRKIKTMTDKSIIEFILSYKMKKAARLMIEDDISLRQIMDRIGIESQPYFTNAFKKEFGETPSAFIAKHRKKTAPNDSGKKKND
jgi:signal transduction histidine kinase/ligand-binding sensor domain-containing protein/DNA-binding response OmpR family regulator